MNAEEMEILKASPVRMELPYNWAGELIRRQERAGKNSYCSHKESRLLRENLVGWRNAMQALRGARCVSWRS